MATSFGTKSSAKLAYPTFIHRTDILKKVGGSQCQLGLFHHCSLGVALLGRAGYTLGFATRFQLWICCTRSCTTISEQIEATELSICTHVQYRYAVCDIQRHSLRVNKRIRPSICLIVTRRYCIKTAKLKITQTTLHDSPGTLVFRRQRLAEIRTGCTPNGGAKCRWGRLISATFDK